MAVTLNRRAYEHAKELINEGRFVFDERDDWSEHQPSALQESEYIRLHGFAEYGKCFLGINDERPENTKAHYAFPLRRFQRCSPLWRTGCGKPGRPIPALRHRECRGPSARHAGRPQGCNGAEAYTDSFGRQDNTRHPTSAEIMPTPRQRFATHSTTLSSKLMSRQVASGK